ncbi:hypothetical protein J2X84_001847 [Pseudomonas corrugata]|jgi:hypothetical protein|uniref:hypothetical protein n=1 Tax=Pseudomonas corrugata TaxID=47879 RepID=UPI0028673C74|nr:hypothetical protein [Pseudomonas corrugata]MDR7283023.1 hypothetical protein [Pseudomonas corrugata]
MDAKQQIAEIDRVNRRNAPIEIMAGLPPTVPDILSDTDRRVKVDKIGAGMKLPIILKLWEIQDEGDTVIVQIRKAGVTTWTTADTFSAGSIDSRPPEFTRIIPADLLTEDNPPATPTIFEVRYTVRPPIGNPWNSDIITIIIDRRAPHQATPGGPKARPPIATLPQLSPGDLIDDAFIQRNPTGMEVTIAITHQNPLPTDRIRFNIAERYQSNNPTPPLYEGLLGTGVFTIPVENLRGIDPRANYAFYELHDGVGTNDVGNVSNLSVAKGLKVRFTPLPILDEPIVPLAVTDKLIDIKDCREPGGVTVEVKRPDNVLPTDEVRCKWNNKNLGEFPFLTHDPLIIQVTFVDIFDDYYKDGADTETDVPVTVMCELLRSTDVISTSNTNLAANIYYPGSVNPIDPAPENQELNAPHITSTAVNDILEPVDYNKDHTVTIELWSDADKPVKAGQQIFGEYAGQRFGPEFLADGQTTVDITLEWALIFSGGLGADKSLQYFVSDIGGVNENPSPIQKVTNNAIVVVMDPPVVAQENPGTLYCDDLRETGFGLKVKVPGNIDHFLDGRSVILYAQGYRDEAMTELADGTDFESAPHLIGGTEPADGFELVITPYIPFIRNIPNPPPNPIPNPPGDYSGWWKIWYALDINGTPYPSLEYYSKVYLVNARGEYCEDQ